MHLSTYESSTNLQIGFDLDQNLLGQRLRERCFGLAMVGWSRPQDTQRSLRRRARSSSIPIAYSLTSSRHIVTIISNQAGISLKPDPKGPKPDQKRLSEFKAKVGYVLAQLDFPVSIYAATAKDIYRKPRVGMWKELLEDYDLDVVNGPELEHCFFVGDAGGRVAQEKVKADHSSSDR